MNTYYLTNKAIGPKGILTLETDAEMEGLDDEIFVEDAAGKTYQVGKDAFLSLDDARLDSINRAKRKIKSIVKAELKLDAKIAKWESELPT